MGTVRVAIEVKNKEGVITGASVNLTNVTSGISYALTEDPRFPREAGTYVNLAVPEGGPYKAFVDGEEWHSWGLDDGRYLYNFTSQTISHAHSFWDDYWTSTAGQTSFPFISGNTFLPGSLVVKASGVDGVYRTDIAAFSTAVYRFTENANKAGFTLSQSFPTGTLVTCEYIIDSTSPTSVERFWDDCFVATAGQTAFPSTYIMDPLTVRVMVNGKEEPWAARFPSAVRRFAIDVGNQGVTFNAGLQVGDLVVLRYHKS